MTAPRDYDAIVVGAGVAGSVAAAALAGQGLSILMVEPGQRTERRLAGELLHPPAVSGLRSSASTCRPGDEPGRPHPGLRRVPRQRGRRRADDPPLWRRRGRRPRAEPRPAAVAPRVPGGGAGRRRGPARGPRHRTRPDPPGRAAGDDPRGRGAQRRPGPHRHRGRWRRLHRAWHGRDRSSPPPALDPGRAARPPRQPAAPRGYGHLFLGAPAPALAYEIGGDDVRVMFDLPGGTDAGNGIPPEHMPPPCRQRCGPRWRAGRQALRYNSQEITVDSAVRGRVALVGDAGGSCHPLTATGMTVAIHRRPGPPRRPAGHARGPGRGAGQLRTAAPGRAPDPAPDRQFAL